MPYPPPGENYTWYGPSDEGQMPACDPAYWTDVTVNVPFYSQENQAIYYADISTVVVVDEAQFLGANCDLLSLLTELAWLVGNDPKWQAVYDPASESVTAISGGENVNTTDSNIVFAKCEITTIGRGVDAWWGTTQFRKFGVFAFGYDTKVNPEFINFAKQAFVIPGSNNATGWTCLLQPGCSGSVKTYKRMHIPDLQYAGSVVGSGNFPVPQ